MTPPGQDPRGQNGNRPQVCYPGGGPYHSAMAKGLLPWRCTLPLRHGQRSATLEVHLTTPPWPKRESTPGLPIWRQTTFHWSQGGGWRQGDCNQDKPDQPTRRAIKPGQPTFTESLAFMLMTMVMVVVSRLSEEAMRLSANLFVCS